MPFQGLEIFNGFFVHPGFSSWAEIACPFGAIVALKGQVMIALGRTQGDNAFPKRIPSSERAYYEKGSILARPFRAKG